MIAPVESSHFDFPTMLPNALNLPASESIDLFEAMSRAAHHGFTLARRKSLAFLFEYDGEPVHVLGDARRLSAVAEHLLCAAIRVTDAGRTLFVARVDRVSEGHCRVSLSVSASGARVDSSTLSRLPRVTLAASLCRGAAGRVWTRAGADDEAATICAELTLECAPGPRAPAAEPARIEPTGEMPHAA